MMIGVVLVGCGQTTPEVVESQASVGSEVAAGPADTELVREPLAPARSAGIGTPPTFACRLESNFSRCIVERLEPDSEADFILLVNSYLMLGESEEAREQMRTFVSRYPESPQARTYRDHLDL